MGDGKLSAPSCSIPELGISFSNDQLEYLNTYFTNLEQSCNHALNSYYETMTPSGGGPNLLGMDVPGSIEAIMERLVQRVITAVGSLDPRFASKYILSTGSTYEHYKINEFDEFDFMVRLDQLSSPSVNGWQGNSPCEFIDDPKSVPQGYAKVRVRQGGNTDNQWTEFMDENGFLLPDKIRKRFYELVRWAIRATPVSMSVDEVDETKLPGASGKVLDVGILSDVLHLDPDDHIYIGIGESVQDIFPDPKEFSIKVSQDGPAVRLDMIVPPMDGVQEQRVSVDLTISIGVNQWPIASDFPERLPHDHIDAIHSYRAGKKGCHIVCTGPHDTVVCKDRSTLWRLSHSSAEMDMMTHFDHCSIPAKVMRITKILIGGMSNPEAFTNLGEPFKHLVQKGQDKTREPLQTLSTYVLKTLFLFELEKYPNVEDWLESSASNRVLSIFKSLVIALKEGKQRSYFYPECNILLRKGVDITECREDHKTILDFMKHLFDFSLLRPVNLRVSPSLESSISFENDITALWNNSVIKNNKNTNIDIDTMKFNARQMGYLNRLYSQIITFAKFRGSGSELYKLCKNQNNASLDLTNVEHMSILLEEILLHVLPKTKQKMQNLPRYQLAKSAINSRLQDVSGIELLHEGKLAEYIIPIVRALIKNAKDEDSELARGMETYLKNIYHCSWVHGWFNEDIDECLTPQDLERVKKYARKVLAGCDAQKEFEQAVANKEEWAVILAEDLVTLGSIRLIFTPKAQQQVVHFIKRFPVDGLDIHFSEEDSLLADLARRFPSVTAGCEGPSARTIHCKLATDNPYRAVLDKTRRYGHHRTPGALANGLLRAGFRDTLDKIRTQRN